MTVFTDAQRTFADSAEGKRDIALARRRYEMGQAHRGAHARPWTDAMAADVIRTGSVTHARANLQRAHLAITAPRDLATARAARETALAMRNDAVRNAWKGSN